MHTFRLLPMMLLLCLAQVIGSTAFGFDFSEPAHMFEHMAFKDTTDLEAELAAMKVEDSIWADLRLERKKGQLASKSYWGESPFGEGNISEMYVERAL